MNFSAFRRLLPNGLNSLQCLSTRFSSNKVTVKWLPNSDLQFEAYDSKNPKILLSGSEADGIGPMKLLLMSLGGCSSVDIIAILKKQHQNVKNVNIEVSGDRAIDWPRPFTHIRMHAVLEGDDLNPKKVETALSLAITKYCGVYASLKSKITYTFEIK